MNSTANGGYDLVSSGEDSDPEKRFIDSLTTREKKKLLKKLRKQEGSSSSSGSRSKKKKSKKRRAHDSVKLDSDSKNPKSARQ